MLEANATAKDVLYLAKPDFVAETMPKAKAKVGRPKIFVSKVEKGQLVFKMTKHAEPTMEKCVICGLGADVILEKKSMVRICHGCQEVTAATSDTQPPAVPGSGAAGGGGALEVPGSEAATLEVPGSKVKKRISKRSRTNKPVEKGHSTGVRKRDLFELSCPPWASLGSGTWTPSKVYFSCLATSNETSRS